MKIIDFAHKVHGAMKKKARKSRTLRALYDVWRANPHILKLIKALFGILNERLQQNKSKKLLMKAGDVNNLGICIYDTDKENIVHTDKNIVCNSVAVVVCVHNALEDVKECLVSLWNCRSFPYTIIIVDDGSDEATKDYLEQFCNDTNSMLIRHEKAWGYTRSANDGLRHGRDHDYVVLLNSDTILTSGWIEKMLEVFEQYPKTGIVGPLSNSATYQSVPQLRDSKTGEWKKNELLKGFTVELMNHMIETMGECETPVVPSLNGFCTMISKSVIETVGLLDEQQFPVGYGEEVDYCLRARKAGYELRVASNVYIFHEKSKSFGSTNKKKYSQMAEPYLKETYGEMYSEIGTVLQENAALMKIRNTCNKNIYTVLSNVKNVLGKKIGFVLLTRGGNGGANSVCQEVMGMRKLGFDAYVINTLNYYNEFSANYPELKEFTLYYKKGSVDDLKKVTKDFDIIIATIFTSVKVIKQLLSVRPDLASAYYIQDDETMFFEKDDCMYDEAYKSYTLIDKNCLFAKTNWLVEDISSEHNVEVHKVQPSMDTRLYNPYVIKEKKYSGKLTMVAMVRPRTPRRNPEGTMAVLSSLKKKLGDKIEIQVFGCSDEEIKSVKGYEPFEFTNLGVLKKGDVAKALAKADMFLDMSYYQAFGRTGLEGMSYGCIPVLPIAGGTDEYAVDNVNAIVADTKNNSEVAERILDIAASPEKMVSMQKEAIKTARRYNVISASWSELLVLDKIYE